MSGTNMVEEQKDLSYEGLGGSWVSKFLDGICYNFRVRLVEDLLEINDINTKFQKIIAANFKTKNKLTSSFEITKRNLSVTFTDTISGLKTCDDDFTDLSLSVSSAYTGFFINYAKDKKFKLIDMNSTRAVSSRKVRTGSTKYPYINRNNIEFAIHEGYITACAEWPGLEDHIDSDIMPDTNSIREFINVFLSKTSFTFTITFNNIDKRSYDLRIDTIINVPLEMSPQLTIRVLDAVSEADRLISHQRAVSLKADKIYDCA